jgi:hypothetical protein
MCPNIEPATWDNEMNVGVMREGLSPSVQDCEESELGLQALLPEAF